MTLSPETTVCLLLLAVVTVHMSTALAASPDCIVSLYHFRHDTVFTIPGRPRCLHYRCRNQVVRLHSEGCERKGRCYSIGETYEEDCRRYRCERAGTTSSPWYRFRNIVTLCKDADGVCRQQGQVYPFIKDGRRYTKCWCTISRQQSRSTFCAE